MDIYVPRNNPEVFEEEFIKKHAALRMKTTSGSGSYWSDGDGRADAVRHDEMTFALEAKTRWSDEYVNAKPRAREWRKAMGEKGDVSRSKARGQLRKFDRTALRLFAVYYNEDGTYAVSIPERDFNILSELIDLEDTIGQRETISSKGYEYPYLYLPYQPWKKLYGEINAQLTSPDLTNIFD